MFCENETVCLNGIKTYDYDTTLGDLLTYSWDFDRDGIADASGPAVSLTVDVNHPKIVTLLVQDSYGVESKDYALLIPRSDCFSGNFICDVGSGGQEYDPFYMLNDVSCSPDNGFSVLNRSEAGDRIVHKFSPDCEFEFSFVPAEDSYYLTTMSSGNFCFLNMEDQPFKLVQYSSNDGSLAQILDLSNDPGGTCDGYSGIEFDAVGNIYIKYDFENPSNPPAKKYKT